MKLNRGLNLGGYLSQCKHQKEHYETFIDKKDIEKIAEWGFDHVRLPIDYEVLEDEAGNKKDEGYQLIDRIISWCEEYNLNIILDLHKAYGYDFNHAGNSEKNNLFTDKYLQERFINLWVTIAETYGSNENVTFELLNEVVEEENAVLWNELIAQTVLAIRKVTQTPIIYGGIQWNSAKTLKLLDIPSEKNIIFTFHFYEPLLFTHQKAHWVETMPKDMEVKYPALMDDFRKQSTILGYQGENTVYAKSLTMGKEFIKEMVQEAVGAANKAGVSLYCGEFGVIDQAPVEDTLRWFQDVDEVFRTYDIGCAIWTYREMDFGIEGKHYETIRKDLLRLWTGQAIN